MAHRSGQWRLRGSVARCGVPILEALGDTRCSAMQHQWLEPAGIEVPLQGKGRPLALHMHRRCSQGSRLNSSFSSFALPGPL